MLSRHAFWKRVLMFNGGFWKCTRWCLSWLDSCFHLSQFAVSVRGLSLTLSLASSVMARWRLVWGVGWLVGSWPGGTAASASGRPSHKRFGCLLGCEQTWFPQGSSHNLLASHSHCWLSHAWNKTNKLKESVKIKFINPCGSVCYYELDAIFSKILSRFVLYINVVIHRKKFI